MAVLQVLAEVIGAEEFLGLVALVKLVRFLEVLSSCFQVLRGRHGHLCAAYGRRDARSWKVFATVTACVCLVWRV